MVLSIAVTYYKMTLKAYKDGLKDGSCICNVDECKVLHIGIRNPQMDYSMSNGNITFDIAKCDSEKDLRVIFDSKLNYDNHIETIIKKSQYLRHRKTRNNYRVKPI